MTPERFQKLQLILQRRQPDLTVLMDCVQKTHNLAAIVRSCDAVGIQTVHAISGENRLHIRKNVARGCEKWLDVKTHKTITAAYAQMRKEGKTILCAHPVEEAIDFQKIDYTKPIAIVIGAELQGLSEEAKLKADGFIAIPLLGMVQSLNVSVATAIILFEAKRQREAAGFYDRQTIGNAPYKKLLFEWAHPQIAEHHRRRNLPYPELDDNGEIVTG